VLGRCARAEDLDRAEAVFARARGLAERHGLAVWRIRALHELGTIELFRDVRGDRLTEARDLALSAGALATAAMIEIQIAAVHDMRSEPGPTIEVARRSFEAAHRMRLDLIAAMALMFEACGHAKAGDRSPMEQAIAEALRLAGDHPDVASGVWGSARAMLSLIEENRPRARRELTMAVEHGRQAASPAPFRSFWALLRTLDDDDGAAACATVRASGVTINPVNRGYLEYADAVEHGRAGRPTDAAAAVARGDALLAQTDWYRAYGRRLIAEAAIADGWGEPARWLRDAETHFLGRGHERVAAACRALLRKAGAAPARPSRQAGVPPGFRALGVTARELEVLAVLAEGLSNREVGERLYLSPRTVEKHVASLMVKTGTHTRGQLTALAVHTAVPTDGPTG
jgi:DNA-binding CsgD family transcriptional regulator